MHGRSRWLAVTIGALALAYGAATLAQRAHPRPRVLAPGNSEPQRWRSPTDPQVKTSEIPAQLATSSDSPLATESPRPASRAVSDDPMGAVETFLQRNRKEADDSIQALTLEAEELRARLAKVEAALGRWQAVADALKGQDHRPVVVPSSGGTPPIDGPLPPAKEGPGPASEPDPAPAPALPENPRIPAPATPSPPIELAPVPPPGVPEPT